MNDKMKLLAIELAKTFIQSKDVVTMHSNQGIVYGVPEGKSYATYSFREIVCQFLDDLEDIDRWVG